MVAIAGLQSHAALVDFGQVTRDTSTGLDWLDLTATQGQSYEAVLAGQFVRDGWRYAAGNEVRALFSQYVGPQSDTYGRQGYDAALAVIALLGATYSWNSPAGALNSYGPDFGTGLMTGGRFDDGTAFPYVGIGQVVAFESLGSQTNVQAWLARADEAMPTQDATIPAYGSFLVRAVPEPGVVSLLLVALVGSRAARRTAACASSRRALLLIGLGLSAVPSWAVDWKVLNEAWTFAPASVQDQSVVNKRGEQEHFKSVWMRSSNGKVRLQVQVTCPSRDYVAVQMLDEKEEAEPVYRKIDYPPGHSLYPLVDALDRFCKAQRPWWRF